MDEDDDLLDGCDVDFETEALPDDEQDLFVLFAEALDPENPKTVEQAEAEWKELFNESK
jgi:hypothetical protein